MWKPLTFHKGTIHYHGVKQLKGIVTKLPSLLGLSTWQATTGSVTVFVAVTVVVAVLHCC